MSSNYPPNYPPAGSGQPPGYPQQPPAPVWDPTIGQWVYPPAGAVPPPPQTLPPAQQPPPGYPPQPYAQQPNTQPFIGHPNTQQPYAGPPAGDVAFGEVAWIGGLPVGSYNVRIDDIEATTASTGTEQLKFSGTTVQPTADVPAGRKTSWFYALSEAAIGRLGRDMVKAGINGQTRYSRDSRTMAGQLLQELRGVVVEISCTQRRDSEGTNVAISGRPAAAAAMAPGGPNGTVPPAAVPPPYVAPPVAAAPNVPPSGATGFRSV